MARQLIRYNAIRRADSLDDQLAAATIAAREASAVTQEDLQEGVLSQLKRVLVGDDAGGWARCSCSPSPLTLASAAFPSGPLSRAPAPPRGAAVDS